MLKDFARLNYYEMLDVKPDAVAFEIRQAYNAALQVYQPGSLVSYSFFSEDERREILSCIQTAYRTLSSDQARKDYDEALIGKGELEAGKEDTPAIRKPVSIFNVSHSPAARIVLTDNESCKNKVKESQCISDILARNELCGADLKQIRMELGVTVEQISEETKIRHDHLRNIEEDRVALLPAAIFLKGFVKSYLKYLYLEPADELAARYMETVARLSQSRKAEGT